MPLCIYRVLESKLKSIYWVLVKIKGTNKASLEMFGGQGPQLQQWQPPMWRALSSPRGPLCVLCSAHGSLDSMGPCWAQTGSGVYAFLYYSPVLRGWCGRGTCHSLVFSEVLRSVVNFINSYLISLVFLLLLFEVLFCCCSIFHSIFANVTFSSQPLSTQ